MAKTHQKTKPVNADYQQVGAQLRLFREIIGLRQNELAEKIGKAPGMVNSYEKGVTYPRLDTLQKYFELGFNLASLYDPAEPLQRPPATPGTMHDVNRKIMDLEREVFFLKSLVKSLHQKVESLSPNTDEARDERVGVK